MVVTTKRKTSLSLDATALDSARELQINVSAVAEEALVSAIAKARREKWLQENAAAFEAQAQWHAQIGHPLAEIMAAPGASSWTS
jgi:antitoxin CcdA